MKNKIIIIFLTMCLLGAGCQKSTQIDPAQFVPVYAGLKPYPGAVFKKIDDSTRTCWYASDADMDVVYDYYADHLAKRNPVKPKEEDWKVDKMRGCPKRWHWFRFSEGMYIIKGQRALLISVKEGLISYTRKDAGNTWARIGPIHAEEYITVVTGFADRLAQYNGDNLDNFILVTERKFYATIERLTELLPDYSLELTTYMAEHPELKDKGVPAFLQRLNYQSVIEQQIAGGNHDLEKTYSRLDKGWFE